MLILLCGVTGAWLLVAGPLYQAALDLSAQEIARVRIVSIATSIPRLPKASRWWWLFPPVMYILERRRSKAFLRDYTAALSLHDFSALMALQNKAFGWLLVAAGALLLAIKETYQLTVSTHRSFGTFVALSAGLVVVCVGISAGRTSQTARLLAQKKATAPAQAAKLDT